jgi:hypothetical protein
MPHAHRRRRCHHCEKLFSPDPRSNYRQKYCSAPACQKASKLLSQQRWRAKAENKGYWVGPEEVRRVTAWRKANPQYWKRPARRRGGTLQDDCRAENTDSKGVSRGEKEAPLQDDCIPDDPLLAGVIATLAGSTLQEDIAAMCRRLVAVGSEILRRQTTAGDVSTAPKPFDPA